MNLSELIMNIQQLAPQLASTCCIVNGEFMTLEDVEKMEFLGELWRLAINHHDDYGFQIFKGIII